MSNVEPLAPSQWEAAMRRVLGDILPRLPPPPTQQEKLVDMRDAFAAAALNGLLAAPDCGLSATDIVRRAYFLADKMLQRRVLPMRIPKGEK